MAGVISTDAAASRLGLSRRQVTNLVRAGEIAAIAPNAVTATSVARYAVNRTRGGSRRAWAERTAWQALAILSGVDVHLIGQTQRSRLKASMRTMSAQSLVLATRHRARTVRCVGHRTTAPQVSNELVDMSKGETALGLTLIQGRVDGYTSTTKACEIISRFHLRIDPTADDAALLRVVDQIDLRVVHDLADASQILAAVGLAESLDVRERSTGLRRIEQELKALS